MVPGSVFRRDCIQEAVAFLRDGGLVEDAEAPALDVLAGPLFALEVARPDGLAPAVGLDCAAPWVAQHCSPLVAEEQWPVVVGRGAVANRATIMVARGYGIACGDRALVNYNGLVLSVAKPDTFVVISSPAVTVPPPAAEGLRTLRVRYCTGWRRSRSFLDIADRASTTLFNYFLLGWLWILQRLLYRFR
jgi:hypothetical protein